MIKKLRYTLGAVAASLALMLGVAMPVAAGTDNSCVDDSCNNTSTTDNSYNTDNSVTLGDCAVYNKGDSDVDQDHGRVESEVENEIDDEVEDEANVSQIGTSNASSSQSASSGVNINTDCSTNNVTNVTEVTEVLGTQVDAPQGAVQAGAGGAATSGIGSVVGLFGSVTTAAAGFVARRKWNV